ncbi:hypothetical protein PMIN01_02128 [Paraphaeosphaeria minitans]|uniref:Uncharacterized protein n=1 Tax=Paraphaeosphaeria minitans TaxID=565426 RepID=A0A9P6KV47_9PLEO|nr:hypothetical protein PMIN01_02128 [Paraphaeosphaeria minitans]
MRTALWFDFDEGRRDWPHRLREERRVDREGGRERGREGWIASGEDGLSTGRLPDYLPMLARRVVGAEPITYLSTYLPSLPSSTEGSHSAPQGEQPRLDTGQLWPWCTLLRTSVGGRTCGPGDLRLHARNCLPSASALGCGTTLTIAVGASPTLPLSLSLSLSHKSRVSSSPAAADLLWDGRARIRHIR